MKTFVAFSGGVDSTYNLYRWLKENPEDKILVHHVVYFNKEGTGLRGYFEKESVDKILSWLNSQGLTNYEYRESILDLTNFPRHGLDTITLASIHSTLLLAYPDIEFILDNSPEDEFKRLGWRMKNRKERRDRIMNIIIGRKLTPIYSITHMSKQEIVNSMPKELFELTWYCRSPNEDGSTCGKCHTCKQVQE